MYLLDDGPPAATAVADLDGDGALDIIIARPHAFRGQDPDIVGAVAVLFGGDASYARATLPTGENRSPMSLAIDDLDNDGRLDIVAGDGDNDETLVLRNAGGRSFTLLAPIATGRPFGLTLGDIDGDGNLDLAIAANVISDERGAGVLFGHGDGTFGPETLYPTGADVTSHTSSIALADVDSDGLLDLVVANAGAVAGGDSVAILRGRADATFETAVTYPSGLDPTSLQVSDLDGDGALDIAVANSSESSDSPTFNRTISVLFNDGHGAFASSSTYSIGRGLTGLLVEDRNGDGKPDLVGANSPFDQPEFLVELINQGDRTFAPAMTATPATPP